jgi:hypothetical protein
VTKVVWAYPTEASWSTNGRGVLKSVGMTKVDMGRGGKKVLEGLSVDVAYVYNQIL